MGDRKKDMKPLTQFCLLFFLLLPLNIYAYEVSDFKEKDNKIFLSPISLENEKNVFNHDIVVIDGIISSQDHKVCSFTVEEFNLCKTPSLLGHDSVSVLNYTYESPLISCTINKFDKKNWIFDISFDAGIQKMRCSFSYDKSRKLNKGSCSKTLVFEDGSHEIKEYKIINKDIKYKGACGFRF